MPALCECEYCTCETCDASCCRPVLSWLLPEWRERNDWYADRAVPVHP